MEKFIDFKTIYQDGDVRVECVVSKPVIKVLSVFFKGGNELFTTNKEFMNCAKSILCNKEIQGFDLIECVNLVDDVVKYSEERGMPIDLNGLSELDFLEIFFRPVLSLAENEKCNCILDTLYAPRDNYDECIEELSEFIPSELIERTRKMRNIFSLGNSRCNGYDVLDNLLYLLKSDRPQKDIYTYIMTDGSGLYKIGKAFDVDKRLKSLQCGNATIKIVETAIGDYENYLHKKFKSKRVKGEWFSLNEDDLDGIRKLLKH